MMNQIQKKVTITLSPAASNYSKINAEYLEMTGTDNIFEHRDLYNSIEEKYRQTWVLNDITFTEAQAFAEPIRIANPDQHVSLYNYDTNSFIGNTTWNDQVKMFWEYPVYTEEGASIMSMRSSIAQEAGELVAWE